MAWDPHKIVQLPGRAPSNQRIDIKKCPRTRILSLTVLKLPGHAFIIKDL